MMKKSRWWLIGGPCLIVLIGMIGFAGIEKESVYSALLKSLDLIKLNFSDPPSNAVVELARWLGVVYCAGAVITLGNYLIEFFRVKRKTKNQDTIALHGDGVFADAVAAALGKDTIQSKSKVLLSAKKHIIMFDDDKESLDFYQKNARKLQSADDVYMKLDDVQRETTEIGNLRIVNLVENACRTYWIEHHLHAGDQVVMIGSGIFAEQLLTQALLINVMNTNNGIRYSVFGDFDEYRALHEQLENAVNMGEDTLTFYDDTPWYRHMTLLKEADRIILTDDSETNIQIASQLINSGLLQPNENREDPMIHIRVDSRNSMWLFDESVYPFGYAEEMCTKENLFEEKIHASGRICDAVYTLGTDENGKTKLSELTKQYIRRYVESPGAKTAWNQLSVFARRSNYAVAAHDGIKKELLAEYGIKASEESPAEVATRFRALPDNAIQHLQKIEHIRWCRFHFLNNWSFSPVKNKAQKKHNYLVPYEDLDREIQNYDGFYYESLGFRL